MEYKGLMDLDAAHCYQALLSKDRRFDGRIFVGVVTTGVYCRPICPVVPPKPENTRFFACAAAAEAAGFRPCKRCRPETAPGTPAWLGTSAVVSRALRLIAEGALDEGGVEALATRLGIGDRQLRRLFLQHLGASPADVARVRRVHFARALLDETDLPMTEVAFSSGFRSIRQFNHAVRSSFAASPTALRRRRARNAVAEGGGVAVRLAYRPPLAWTEMLRFLAARAIPGLEAVEGGRYRRLVEANGAAGVVEVSLETVSRRGSGGSAGHRNGLPRLSVRIHLPRCEGFIDVVERVRRLFDLDADPWLIGEQLRRSPRLRANLEAHPGLRVPGAWEPFELAVRAVLGQQVTVRGATTLAGRLLREFGTPTESGDAQLTHLFPRAETLAGAALERLGLPAARAATIRALAAAVAEKRLVLDAAQGLEDVVQRLCAIPGMGPWTAHYIAMRALGEPDAFPSTDLGLRRALGNGAGPASARELDRVAESWRPWRAYAAMHLWIGAKEERR